MAMPKKVLFVITVGLVVSFVAGLFSHPLIFPQPEAPSDPIWARVVKEGVIRVGSSPDWPPYEFYLEGKWAGFEVELVEMIAERLGLTVEWIEMDFDLIIPEVRDKGIDLGVSGFSVYPPRLEVVQFTMPHSITEGQIIMLKSRRDELRITEIYALEELVNLGLKCGAQVGTTQHEELMEKAGEALMVFDDYVLALAALEARTIDCIYAETPVTSWWILEAEKAGKEPLVVIYRRSYWPVAFVAHHDAHIFVRKINGALAEIIAEGKLDELKEKWRC